MRVAIVIERFERGPGGVEAAAVELIRELARRDLEVVVVCREATEPVPASVSLIRIPAPRLWQPLRISAFSRGAAAATRDGFDVVHAFSRTRVQDVYRAGGGSHASYMDRMYAAPGWRRTLSPRHRAILRIEEGVFRDPHQTIQCNSEMTRREIAGRYGVEDSRLATIYNGVDTDRFHPDHRDVLRAKLRDELRIDGPIALFVGSGFERKGLDLAIRDLARDGGEAVLLVAGRGNVRKHRDVAGRHGVEERVRFLGPRADVEALHAAADLLVLPTRYDSFSNACLEAMASGLPVATTPTNGAAELIESGENGLICDDDFGPAFALLREPGRLAALGQRARATAERFTWARHGDETMALYARRMA